MSQNQGPSREAIVILENDESLLGVLRAPKFGERLKTEGVDAELLVLETVNQLREKIAQNIKVVCLVTDLGGVGWGDAGYGDVPGILRFKDEQNIEAPLLITTGSDLSYVTGFATEAELNKMGISLLRKDYSLGKLIARIKLLINAARYGT